MKRNLLFLLFCFIVMGMLSLSTAGPPEKKSTEIAPLEDLRAESEAKIKLLEKYLASDESFVAAKKDDAIPQAAGVLACLAQATVEHKKNKTNQSSAALRDAALEVRDAKSIADARKGLQQVKLAWKGDTSGSSNLKYAWDKLISRGALMAELETRQIKLRRIVKRPRKPASDSLHATTGAVLALALSADTSGAESKSDIAEWKALAKQYQTTMTELIGALKKKDSKASRALHTAGQLTCTKCHQKYEVE